MSPTDGVLDSCPPAASCAAAASAIGSVPPDEVELRIELGRGSLAADAISKLGLGQVLVLDQAIEDPVEIYARGRLVARGELLVREGQFFVRVVEVVCVNDES